MKDYRNVRCRSTQRGCLRRSHARNHVRAGGYDLRSETWQLRRVTFGLAVHDLKRFADPPS